MRGEKKRTLVFGGTFDPPHHGHIVLVESVLSAGLAEDTVFVPALRPPHKTFDTQAEFRDRTAMLKLAIGDSTRLAGNVSISEIEAERPNSLSYTYDTMLELSSRLSGAELILLIGADSLMNLHTWNRAGKLVEKWSALTFPRGKVKRGSSSVLKALVKNWTEETARRLFNSIMEFAPVEVSSSRIRKCLFAGDYQTPKRFLSPFVLEYIEKKGIYGKKRHNRSF